jgi:hypothetical protein
LDEDALGEEMKHDRAQEDAEDPEEQKSTHVLCARALLGLSKKMGFACRL